MGRTATSAQRELAALEEVWPSARTNFVGEAWAASWADWEPRLKKLKKKIEAPRNRWGAAQDSAERVQPRSSGLARRTSACLRPAPPPSNSPAPNLALNFSASASAAVQARHHGKRGRAAAGHERGRRAVGAQEFLEQRQQRIFLQRRRFERVVELRSRRLQVGALQQGDELLRPARAGRSARAGSAPVADRPRRWQCRSRDESAGTPRRAGPGRIRAARICSPRPVASAGWPCRKNGTSEPSDAARRCNCSGASGPPNSSFNPSSVVAALPLPPPKPAASGMFFSSSSRTPVLDSCRLQKQRRGAIHQVARVGRQAGHVAAQLNALAGPREAQPVEHADRVATPFPVRESRPARWPRMFSSRLTLQGDCFSSDTPIICHNPAQKDTKSWRPATKAARVATKKSASTGMLALLRPAAGRTLLSVENLEPAARDVGRYVAAAEAHVGVGREQRVVNDVRPVVVRIHRVGREVIGEDRIVRREGSRSRLHKRQRPSARTSC